MRRVRDGDVWRNERGRPNKEMLVDGGCLDRKTRERDFPASYDHQVLEYR